jgi:hypothetical protein
LLFGLFGLRAPSATSGRLDPCLSFGAGAAPWCRGHRESRGGILSEHESNSNSKPGQRLRALLTGCCSWFCPSFILVASPQLWRKWSQAAFALLCSFATCSACRPYLAVQMALSVASGGVGLAMAAHGASFSFARTSLEFLLCVSRARLNTVCLDLWPLARPFLRKRTVSQTHSA